MNNSLSLGNKNNYSIFSWVKYMLVKRVVFINGKLYIFRGNLNLLVYCVED